MQKNFSFWWKRWKMFLCSLLMICKYIRTPRQTNRHTHKNTLTPTQTNWHALALSLTLTLTHTHSHSLTLTHIYIFKEQHILFKKQSYDSAVHVFASCCWLKWNANEFSFTAFSFLNKEYTLSTNKMWLEKPNYFFQSQFWSLLKHWNILGNDWVINKNWLESKTSTTYQGR